MIWGEAPLSVTALRIYRGIALDAARQLATDKADAIIVNSYANDLIAWAEQEDGDATRSRYSAIQAAYASRFAANRPPDDIPGLFISEAEQYLLTLRGGALSGLEG
jgi:hypothetical protein